MIVSLSLLVGGCGGGAVQPPVAAINFADPILEAAVRNAAGYTGQPTGPIYPADVLGITVLNLNGPNGQVDRYGKDDRNSGSRGEGLEHLILLKNEERHRWFGEWEADNEPLSRGAGGLVSLEGIQHLTNLEYLYFSNNKVSNITPLQHLTKLQLLIFDNNLVSNITPLQNLVNLQYLSINYNQVSDLTPLQNLTNLHFLWLYHNQVSNITSLRNLTNLLHLVFFSNQVSNITTLQHLTNLRLLSFGYNQVSDLLPLQTLTNLQELYFGNNQVSNIVPLQNLTNLKWLYFEHNQVSDITPLVNNAGIGDGDTVDMRYNYLDLNPWSIDFFNIQFLKSRGCTVFYNPQN
jgi:hypothetical protein